MKVEVAVLVAAGSPSLLKIVINLVTPGFCGQSDTETKLETE